MADRADRNRWLLDAEEAVGTTVAHRVAWLKTQRATYSERIREGDWEIQSTTSEGGSSTARRGVSDKANHDAIVAALRYLGDTDLGSEGALLQVQFGGIQG
jgi:hypothetical protein